MSSHSGPQFRSNPGQNVTIQEMATLVGIAGTSTGPAFDSALLAFGNPVIGRQISERLMRLDDPGNLDPSPEAETEAKSLERLFAGSDARDLHVVATADELCDRVTLRRIDQELDARDYPDRKSAPSSCRRQ